MTYVVKYTRPGEAQRTYLLVAVTSGSSVRQAALQVAGSGATITSIIEIAEA